MTKAQPKSSAWRRAVYRNGLRWKLTPPQRRRIRHKANRAAKRAARQARAEAA
jgi:hypothetical protein